MLEIIDIDRPCSYLVCYSIHKKSEQFFRKKRKIFVQPSKMIVRRLGRSQNNNVYTRGEIYALHNWPKMNAESLKKFVGQRRKAKDWRRSWVKMIRMAIKEKFSDFDKFFECCNLLRAQKVDFVKDDIFLKSFACYLTCNFPSDPPLSATFCSLLNILLFVGDNVPLVGDF